MPKINMEALAAEAAKSQKQRDKEYKAMLAQFVNPTTIASRQTMPNTYDAALDEYLTGISNLYFDKTCKDLGLVTGDLQELRNAVRSGATLEDLKKNSAFTKNGLDAALPALFNAAKTDIANQKTMLSSVDKMLKKAGYATRKMSNSKILKELKNKGINLPKVDKQKKKEIQRLQKEYKKQMNAFKKRRLTEHETPTRGTIIALDKPGLKPAEKAKIAQLSQTNEGQLQIAKGFLKEIMHMDPEKYATMTPNQYLKDFAQNEYMRQIIFDPSWVRDELFATKGEREAFDQYMVNMRKGLNVAKGKLDLMVDPLATDIDLTQLDMNQASQLMSVDPRGLASVFAKSTEVAQASAEISNMDIAKTVLDSKKNLDNASTKIWLDAYKSKPDILPVEEIIFKSSEPKGFIAYAATDFVKEYVATAEAKLDAFEHVQYRGKIRDAVKTLLNQAEILGVTLPESNKQALEAISNGADIPAIREAHLKGAQADYLADPSKTNIEKLFDASEKTLQNTVKKPNVLYGNKDPFTTNHDIISSIEHAKLNSVLNAVGLRSLPDDAIKIFEKAGSLEEAKRALANGRIFAGNAEKQEILFTNVEAFYQAAQLDAKEAPQRQGLIDDALHNIGSVKEKEEDLNAMRSFAEEKGIAVYTPEEQERIQEQGEAIKEKFIDYTKTVCSYKSDYDKLKYVGAATALKDVSGKDKQILLDAGSLDPKKMGKAFDVMLGIIENFDTSLVGSYNRMDDHIRDFDTIVPYANIFQDSQQLFKDIDKAIKAGTYQVDETRYNAIKDFAKAVGPRVTNIKSEMELTMKDGSSVINLNKLTKEQALQLSGSSNYSTNRYALEVISSSCKEPVDSMKKVNEAKNYLKDISSMDGPKYLEKLQKEATKDIKKCYKELTQEKHSPAKQEFYRKQMLKSASKLMILKGIESEKNELTSKELKEKLSPKALAPMTKGIKPFVAEALDNTPADEFANNINRAKPEDVFRLIGTKMKDIQAEKQLAQNEKNKGMGALE